MTDDPCDDCGRVAVGRHLLHASTCPLALAAEASSEADRRWFEAHPTATQYWRAPEVYDIDVMRRAVPCPLPEGKWVGKVRVKQLRPGVRVRSYEQILFLFVPGGRS